MAELRIFESGSERRRRLRKSDFYIVEVATGSEAIDRVHGRDGDFDLMLLDLTIQGSSVQARRSWREAKLARPGIKVILTCTFTLVVDEQPGNMAHVRAAV